MPLKPKDYLTFENERNKRYAWLYRDLVQHAFGGDWQTLVGHHVLYQQGSNLETEGEIPSADTLMFDHDIMHAVFGRDCIEIMRELASVPCDQRDALLERYYRERL